MGKLQHPETVTFHGMVTASRQMQDLFDLVQRVAKSDASVLIRGETGTGKELVARALHALSPRSRGPFRAVNCATLTPELLASELFGHVRGAFTGAIRDRRGLFAAAHGGTVFLDEVAELPLDIQARLLRVLQERAFVPVGATEPTQADVRIVSATHKALRDEVDAGRFRDDLMYRVRVVPLFLPSLVERQGDIEALTWHFVADLNRRGGRQIERINDAALEALLAYPWPGNVRELLNTLEYVYAVGEGPTLQLHDLTPELRGEPPPGIRGETMTAGDQERQRILEALQQAGGRKGKAAELLDMSRSTLWRKMREHRI